MKTKRIIRADIVGSLLRPKKLLQAQRLIKENKISTKEFIYTEDDAVRKAVLIQEKAGFEIVTDGEMRRPVFCHNCVDAVEGFKWDIPGNTVIWFDMNGKKIIDPVTVGVVDKIRKVHDISVAELAFLRGITGKEIKITIPSPTMMSYYFVPGISDQVYKPMAFLKDVTKILKDGVSELARQGLEHIQVDAPDFGMLLDPIQQNWFAKKGFDPDILIDKGVEMINEVLEEFPGTKSLHICRGNDKNRFMASGGYGKIAEIVFKNSNVDRLLLEFDSDRTGDFSPLKHVPKDKIIVLGLISTKTPKLEKRKELIDKIDQATEFVPIERLALSTQCGFASVAKGNDLTFSDQTKKLKLVTEVAKTVWG